ncbi:hypothetical protein Tco_0228830 [Tanacetum coccineum]
MNTRFLLREDFISLNSIDEGAFEQAFLDLFGKEFSTIKRIFSQNMDKLEDQLTKEKLHENDSKTALTALTTPFQRFFHSKWPLYTTDKSRVDFQKYTGKYTQVFKDTMIHDIDAIEKYLIEAILHEHEIEKDWKSENNSSEITFSISKNENRISDKESSSSGNDADADIGPSYDCDIVRDKEEHNYVDYEQQRSFFASLISNLKCDVEKCNKVNYEAQQANALLTNELERYKAKNILQTIRQLNLITAKRLNYYMTKFQILNLKLVKKIRHSSVKMESLMSMSNPLLNRKNELEKKNQEFLKQINDLDNKLQKAGQTDQTLQMLLPKANNVQTGKQGLGFGNKIDVEDLGLLNKAKDLEPCLYNIDEMGNKFLSDYKIISKEELKCEADKRLKVKQRRS